MMKKLFFTVGPEFPDVEGEWVCPEPEGPEWDNPWEGRYPFTYDPDPDTV